MKRDEKICPRCAETVKAAALVCKHCDYEFPPPLRPSAHAEEEPKKPRRGLKIFGFILLTVVGVDLFVGVVYGVHRLFESPRERAIEDKEVAQREQQEQSEQKRKQETAARKEREEDLDALQAVHRTLTAINNEMKLSLSFYLATFGAFTNDQDEVSLYQNAKKFSEQISALGNRADQIAIPQFHNSSTTAAVEEARRQLRYASLNVQKPLMA